MTSVIRVFAVVVIGMVMVLAGCNQGITVDYDKSGDAPENMMTYKWMVKPGAKPDPRIDTPHLDNLVMTAVDNSFKNKGYTKIEKGVPNFVVSYCAVVEDVVEAEYLNSHMGMYVQGDVDPEQFERSYEKGALIIDVASPGRPELYWRGSAKAVVDTTKPREERDLVVNEAIIKILKGFPDQKDAK